MKAVDMKKLEKELMPDQIADIEVLGRLKQKFLPDPNGSICYIVTADKRLQLDNGCWQFLRLYFK